MATRRPWTRHRGGFTIKDLMVTIAVIAVGICLWLPATSRPGEGSRRAQCLNHTRQIGLAFQGYLNRNGRFPNATTWGELPAALASGDASQSILQDINRKGPGRFAIAGADGSPTDIGPLHSWVVDLLPDLDQSTLYNDFQTALESPTTIPPRESIASMGGIARDPRISRWLRPAS